MDEQEHIARLTEAYLADELSAEDRTAFEARCETDPDFAAEVRLHILAEAEIRAQGRDALKQRLNQRYDQALSAQEPALYLRPAFWGAAAAVLLLVIVGIFFFRQPGTPTTDQLIATYWENPEVSRFRDRTGEQAIPQWNEALNFFEDSAYASAIPLLDQLLQDSSFMADYGDRTRLYLAISHEKTQAYEKALETLAHISDAGIYADQRIWYEALVYLRMNEVLQARGRLQQIADNPNHFKHTEAKQILEQLGQSP